MDGGWTDGYNTRWTRNGQVAVHTDGQRKDIRLLWEEESAEILTHSKSDFEGKANTRPKLPSE